MKDAQLLQIEQAASPRVKLAIDRGVEAAMLAPDAAERPHQRDIGHHVDHFPVDGRRFGGEIVVQGTAGGREPKQHEDHDAGDECDAAAIGKLMVQTSTIAAMVATQGGSTFQTSNSRR